MQGIGIQNAADVFDDANEYSSEDVAKKISFGIKYLDKCLKGILPTDLVLIAADSGCGKTELATTIALNAGVQNKRVLFFALEAEKNEIERRIAFKLYSQKYLHEYPNPPRVIEFDDWLLGDARELFLPYREKVREEYRLITKNLFTCYKVEESFGVDEFKKILLENKAKVDLVIVDHLHYFDTGGFNQSEMMELGNVTKKIRHMALQEKIPIVLICHVRKKGSDAPLVPPMEAIFGTSDVFKNGTKVVMLAPGNYDMMVPHLYETYVHAAKYRFKGGAKHFLGKIIFNTMINSYEPGYAVGLFRPGDKEFIEIRNDNQLPHWAR